MKPLREIITKGKRFSWSDELEEIFQESKRILLDPITGCKRDPIAGEPFVLYSDSSSYAIGRLLCQRQPVIQSEMDNDKGLKPGDKRIYLIEYFSRQLPATDIAHLIICKEIYSIQECLSKWAHYFGGNEIRVYCDNKSVSYWVSMNLLSERIACCLMKIQGFNVQLRFLPSSLNPSDIVTRQGEPLEGLIENVFHKIPIFNSIG
jgi:hypothetical protein